MSADLDVLAPAGLIGLELAGVAFVRDYVEFHFDGPVWRWYALPNVTAGSTMIEPGAAGYRDALCDLIGAEVSAFSEDAERLALSIGDTVVERALAAPTDIREIAEFQPWTSGPLTRGGPIEWENTNPRPDRELH